MIETFSFLHWWGVVDDRWWSWSTTRICEAEKTRGSLCNLTHKLSPPTNLTKFVTKNSACAYCILLIETVCCLYAHLEALVSEEDNNLHF